MAIQPSVPPPVPPSGKPSAPPAVPQMANKAGGAPLVPGVVPPAGQKPNLKVPAGAQGQPGAAQNVEGEEDNHPPLNFWQQPWVQNLLPFITSLSLHAAVLVIGILFIGVVKAVTAPPHEDQVIIPDSNMVDNGPPGGVPNVGLGENPLQKAMQDKDPTQGAPEGWANKKGPTVDITPEGGGAGDSSDAVIGVGPGGGFGNGGGLGSGKGDGRGGGNGDGSGPMAMFGTPGGGGIGPKGPVFGNGGNARLIVYLCDSTGSMLNKMANLKEELGKSVQNLRPIQSFDIVFYQDIKIEQFDKQLVAATPETKRRAAQWLDGVISSGTTDPIPALETALKLKPQLLYFLTDAADFPDPKGLMASIAKYNKDKKIKINTILFVENHDEFVKNKDSEGLMKQIATENGGNFKWVEIDSLR
jgi:hypothetical protein